MLCFGVAFNAVFHGTKMLDYDSVCSWGVHRLLIYVLVLWGLLSTFVHKHRVDEKKDQTLISYVDFGTFAGLMSDFTRKSLNSSCLQQHFLGFLHAFFFYYHCTHMLIYDVLILKTQRKVWNFTAFFIHSLFNQNLKKDIWKESLYKIYWQNETINFNLMASSIKILSLKIQAILTIFAQAKTLSKDIQNFFFSRSCY